MQQRWHRLGQGVEQSIYHRRIGFYCPVFFTAQLSVLPMQGSTLPTTDAKVLLEELSIRILDAEASISWMPDSSWEAISNAVVFTASFPGSHARK